MTAELPSLGVEDARRQLGDLVTGALFNGSVTVITWHGRPAAAVVPLHMLPADVRAQLEEGGSAASSTP